MRIQKDFVLREIAGEYILVPLGDAAKDLNGIISVNELGAFLWNKLQTEQTEQSLLDAVLQEYEVSREQAQADLQRFLQMLRENNLL